MMNPVSSHRDRRFQRNDNQPGRPSGGRALPNTNFYAYGFIFCGRYLKASQLHDLPVDIHDRPANRSCWAMG